MSEDGEKMDILREGMTGERVASLKARLNELDYDCGPGDVYDRRTAWAVRWFCRLNGLADGDAADDVVCARAFSENAVAGTVEGVPYYDMRDPIWKDYPYDAANTPEIETIATSGCGPTSMAMVVSGALKKSVLPPVLADWANAHGYRDPDGINGTDEAFFPVCAALYGLHSEVRPIEGRGAYADIAEELAKGSMIIINVVPGSPYTDCGHYNLVAAIENGRIRIVDANPKNKDLPSYTVDEWVGGSWAKLYMVVRQENK